MNPDHWLARWDDRWILAALLALAFLLRLPLALVEFFHHADEIWQYVEPAYRLDFGRSIVSWEFRDGVRSWLIPEFFAPPLWVGEKLLGAGRFGLLPLRLVLILLSLAVVWAAFTLGRRISQLHGVAAGLVLAISFEPIFLAARALSEPIATSLLLIAAVMLLARDGARSWAIGGLLLGLAVATRLQFAPAAATLAVLACGLDWRKWGWVIGGGVAGLLVDGVADAAAGAVPFRWMIANYRLNLIEHVAARYGVEPVGWYLTRLVQTWGVTTPFMLMFIAIGVRRQPILFAVAIVHLLAHSLIAHKEFRFIFPAVALLLLVGALGAADVIVWISARGRRWGALAVAAVALVWTGSSALAARDALHSSRLGGRSTIAMWRSAHADPRLCGLASYKTDSVAMAYSYVDRPVPIYKFAERDAAQAIVAHARAYNMVDAAQSIAPVLAPAGFALRRCFLDRMEQAPGASPARCEFVREGGCDPKGSEHYLENAVRVRLGI